MTARLYLHVPAGVGADQLTAVLDRAAVACVRLAAPTPALRTLVQGRDIACLALDTALPGYDGVHLTDPAAYAAARKTLGPDAIVGVAAPHSRHDAMVAGEAGADYVAIADRELLAWWAEMMETPCVAEGLAAGDAAALGADFVLADPALWQAADAPTAFATVAAALQEHP